MEELFQDDPFYSVVCTLIIVVLLYAELFLHEFGHWAAAKAFGYRILGFSVGEGKRLWHREGDSQFYELRLLPTEGAVWCVKDRGVYTRLGSFLVSAGGPLMTFLCFLAAWWGRESMNWGFLPEPWPMMVRQILAILMMLTVISLAYNLWPHSAFFRDSATANDGKSMLQALIGPGFPEPNFYQSALRAFRKEEEKAAIPENPDGREKYLRYVSCVVQERWEDAESALDEAVELSDLGPLERATFLSAYSDLVLNCRRLPRAPKALERLDSALELVPDAEFLQARRCGLLIIERFYLEALQNLEELLDSTQSDRIRAMCHCYLALADARQDRTDDGKARLQLAARLDRECEAFPLAYAAVYRVPEGAPK